MNNFKKSELTNLLKKVESTNYSVYYIGRTVRIAVDEPIQGHSDFEIEFYRNRYIGKEMIEQIFNIPFQELADAKYLDWNDRKKKVFTLGIRTLNEQGKMNFIGASFQKAFINELISKVKRWESLKDSKFLEYKDGVAVISDDIEVRYNISKKEEFSVSVEQSKEVA